MKRKLLLICSVVFISGISFGQVANLGGPLSWKGKDLKNKDVITETMPGYDQSAIDIEDAIHDASKDTPWRFGYKYDTDYTLENSGSWTYLPNGDRVWRIGLKCEGAMTVNLLFEDLYIPDGASMYLFDKNNTNRVGAYTSRNNNSGGLLGTELVHGDHVILEYYEPTNVMGLGHFTIANVVHGYRSLDRIQAQLSKSLNDSGDCNIDVNCPLGNGWDDQIRSVAMIVVNGSGICTGALINNTCDDGTPYFLTANHCLGGASSGSNLNWAFRFNWESPPGTESCATSAGSTDPGAPYDQTAYGATVLEQGTQADHALLLIDNMTLTEAQTWNCFYAGWNNDDTDGNITQATGIHHPSGDLKKICRENDSPYHNTAAGAQVWYIDEWEEGVTEPGSSGSPLFDQNGRIIGQLYGGAAACSGTVNNGAYDYYGRLGVSWGLGIGGHLDPASCGGSVVTNDGWDPNQPTLPDDAGISGIASPEGDLCTDNFIPEVTLRNFGTNDITTVTINYDIDGGANNTFNWTGTLAPGATTPVTLPLMTTTGGAHVFNAYTTLPNGNTDSDGSNDDALSAYTAIPGGEEILLEINTDCWGSEITWEIQDGSANVVASGGPYADITGGEYISQNFCLAIDCYDFIINDSYGDGMYGSQYGSCSVDGDYTITQTSSASVLATIMAADSDFGNQEINNFCVTPPCASTFDYAVNEESCFGDDDASVTVNFLTGNSTGATFDIGNGPQGSGTFTGLAQGSYSVTILDGDVCTTILNVVITGPAELTASATATDENCAGDNDGTVTVTANGGTVNYSYDIGSGNQGSNTFTGLAPNSYTVTITDANNCSTTTTATVGSALVVTGVVTSVTHSSGSNGAIDITISNGGTPYTYAWTGPNGYTYTGEDPSGLEPGTYSVIITDDCGNTVNLDNIIVEDHAGIEEQELFAFTIYPNPSNGIVNIQLSNELSSKFDVAVLDLSGRVVYAKQQLQNNYFTVDLSEMANGTYMLRLSTETTQSTQRIVLKK